MRVHEREVHLTTRQKQRLLQILLVGAIIFNFLLISRQISRDGGAFLAIANVINNGQIPYVDYVDHKPPGIYYFLASVLKLYNTPLFAKLSIFLINILTAVCILLIGKKFHSRRIGIVSAIVYLVSIPLYQGMYILTEQFVALFGVLTIGLVLVSEQDLPQWQSLLFRFFAGLLIGFAFLFKQTGVLISLAIVGYYIVEARERLVLGVLPAAIGSFVPVTGAAIYFWQLGALTEAIHWIVGVHLPGGPYGSQGILSVLLGQTNNLLTVAPLWVLAISGLIHFKDFRREYGHYYTAWSLALTVSAPVILFRTYPHYWIQLLPFAAILAALSLQWFTPRLVAASRERGLLPILLATVIVLSLPVGAAVGQNLYGTVTNTIQDNNPVAQHIQGQSDSGDRILVLTAQPKYYYLSERRPLTENIYYLEVNSRQHRLEQLREQIISTPPKVVVIADCRPYISSVCDLVREEYEDSRSFEDAVVYTNPV